MKRWFKMAVWGIALGMAFGGRSSAKDPSFAKEETSCGDYGTQVHFEGTPSEAAKAAKKEGKLVMVLHISGHFEDPGLT